MVISFTPDMDTEIQSFFRPRRRHLYPQTVLVTHYIHPNTNTIIVNYKLQITRTAVRPCPLRNSKILVLVLCWYDASNNMSTQVQVHLDTVQHPRFPYNTMQYSVPRKL